MSHLLFERRTSVNEHMCMLSRLDHICTRIPSISEIRGMSFFSLAATYLRYTAYYIARYFIFLFIFFLISLKCISVGTISRSCLSSGIIIGVFLHNCRTRRNVGLYSRTGKLSASTFFYSLHRILSFTLSYRIFSHKGDETNI